jgi:hypothetical protein
MEIIIRGNECDDYYPDPECPGYTICDDIGRVRVHYEGNEIDNGLGLHTNAGVKRCQEVKLSLGDYTIKYFVDSISGPNCDILYPRGVPSDPHDPTDTPRSRR